MIDLHRGFQIRNHNPWRIWIAGLLILLLMVLMFLLGFAYQSFKYNQTIVQRDTLREKITDLDQRNKSLVVKNAQLQSASNIEHDAYERVNLSLVRLQKEILQLKEQLVFYQGIVSPEKLALGVNIQSFDLAKKNDFGVYSYKLVLTKRGKSNKYVKGTYSLIFKGQQQGEPKDFSLQQLDEAFEEGETKFSFRYFQTFEGELLLVDGFEPYEIEININPKTKKIKSFVESVSWDLALSGGNN